jgi:hypothetical protein
MAAGAILPPMFFERCLVSLLAPRVACSGTPENNTSAVQRPASFAPATRDKPLPKEI